MAQLEDPTDAERIYLATGTVPVARPLMFGDVIEDVPCSRGGPASPLVMVLTHPCSMRKGATLKDRVVVAHVEPAPYQGDNAEKWVSGYFDFLPLYGLAGIESVQSVVFSDLHAANTADIDLSRRVLALSDYGVAVTLQRWIYQLSRDPVSIGELSDLVAPILAELEIQEDWCQAAIDADPARDQDQVLLESAERVQQVLGRPGSGGLRDRLADPASRADARRTIAGLRRQELGS